MIPSGKSLTERAMLIALNISQWAARKHDRKISDEVAKAHGARRDSSDVGRYNKVLIAKEHLKPIQDIVGSARKQHEFLTLPWSDEGSRILSAEGYLLYAEQFRVYKDKFQAAVSNFLDIYDSCLSEAQVRLNSMFRPEDYPTRTQLAAKFSFDTKVTPLPSAEDFRVTSLGQEDLHKIRREIEERVKTEIAAAAKDPWRRIYDAVTHVSARLKEYDGKAKGSFRDSLIGNLRELVAVLPSLNITGDGGLSVMAERLDSDLCQWEAQALRESDSLREQVAASADSILKQMAEYTS